MAWFKEWCHIPVLGQCIQHGMQFPVQAKLLVTPEGAQGKAAGEITQVATSPTGQHVAAGHADGTIRIWNTDTGDCEVRQIWHASLKVSHLMWRQSLHAM